MSKVLLLGGTGKLGKCVLRELLANSYETGIFIRSLSKRAFDNTNNLRLFEGDITQKDSLTDPVQWSDLVINCSGYVSYRRKDIHQLRLINVEGIRNLVDCCSKFSKSLIHTSSAVIYGSTKQPELFKEDYYPKESYKSGYSDSKIEAEKIVVDADISKVILRPGSLISREKSTLKNLYTFYKKGFTAGLKGGASFALMQDAAKAYIPALELLLKTTPNTGLIFNLGGSNLTLQEIFDTFKNVNPKKSYFLSDNIMYILSKINDSLLFPLFKKSLLTHENYLTGSHFTFVDSSKAIQELQYRITPFDLSLKEII